MPTLVEHLGLPRECSTDIRAAGTLRLLDLEFDRVLDPLRPLADKRRVPRMVGNIAKQRERVRDAAEVRFGLLDDATEVFEHPPVRVDHATDFRLEWNSAKIAPPGDANTLEVPAQRSAELRRVLLD